MHNIAIGDVANWKRHQRLDKIYFFFYLHYIGEISEVVFLKKPSVMQYASEI